MCDCTNLNYFSELFPWIISLALTFFIYTNNVPRVNMPKYKPTIEVSCLYI